MAEQATPTLKKKAPTLPSIELIAKSDPKAGLRPGDDLEKLISVPPPTTQSVTPKVTEQPKPQISPAITPPTTPPAPSTISPKPPLDNPPRKVEPAQTEFQHILDRRKNNKFLAQSNLNLKRVSSDSQGELLSRFTPDLKMLDEKVPTGQSAIFVDGKQQRLYVVEKTANGFKFNYETKVSTGKNGFEGAKDDQRHNATEAHGKASPRKTPSGLFKVYTVVNANPGQVIRKGTPLTLKRKEGPPLPVFMRSTSSGGRAEMTTKALMLEDTDPSIAWTHSAKAKGVGIHGTNKEFRLGNKASDGCIRVSNLDILALDEIRRNNNGSLFVYIKR